MPYPNVLSEVETMRRVLEGASIARYGDGEFKLCRGGDIKSQKWNKTLQERLRAILAVSGKCLVGIPNIKSKTPKSEFWNKYEEASQWMDPEKTYGSAFITRPDSAPWINTPDYWRMVESLWLGRPVTLVRGSGKCLTPDDLMGAGRIRELLCARQHAFREYDEILERVGQTKDRVLICLGPTATVLAVDLCARGMHAIDLGHIAMFLRKFRRGESMELTKDDKSHDARWTAEDKAKEQEHDV